MDNLENLYNVMKTFLPIADKYLSNSPLEPYIPQLQNMMSMIESFGGIQTINSLLSTLKSPMLNTSQLSSLNITNNASPTNDFYNNKQLKSIDSYKKIEI